MNDMSVDVTYLNKIIKNTNKNGVTRLRIISYENPDFRRLWPVQFLSWLICTTAIVGMIAGCRSPEKYKAQADKEVYNIIENKWRDDFGQKTNYKISDADPNESKAAKPIPPSIVLTLQHAVEIATKYNREYQSQKESLYLSALDLTLTRHQYAMQWFGTVDAEYLKAAGVEDNTIGSEAGFNQTLLLGNGIKAGAGLAIDWVRFLSGDSHTTLGSVLSATVAVPLLGSGAGKTDLENLTQAERNVLYRIRSFNRYRKTFVVDIINEYYRVLQQEERVAISEASYQRQIENTNQLRMEVEVGQRAQSDADEAEQRLLTVRNNLVSAQQNYSQALDSFKIRLSLPTDADIKLDPNELQALETIGISQPEYNVEDAIEMALIRRLDLANAKGELDDAQRKLLLAAEGLGVQLNLIGSADVDSKPQTNFERLQFHEGTYSLGLEADLPLDRKAERNAYREALITLQQRQRGYDEDVDRIKLDVRQAFRDLEETSENYRIQKAALALAERRVEEQKLLLEYGRGTIRLLLETEDDLVEAQNNVTDALVRHTDAKMSFFRDIGILEVRPDGMWEQGIK
jgi:outer membrane protein TolC